MTHKLVLVRQTEVLTEWKCPECDRHIRLGSDGSGLKILNPGDAEVNHGSASSVSWMDMGDASVQSPTLH